MGFLDRIRQAYIRFKYGYMGPLEPTSKQSTSKSGLQNNASSHNIFQPSDSEESKKSEPEIETQQLTSEEKKLYALRHNATDPTSSPRQSMSTFRKTANINELASGIEPNKASKNLLQKAKEERIERRKEKIEKMKNPSPERIYNKDSNIHKLYNQ